MTVILIFACVAVGLAELYMARSARQMAQRLDKLETITVLQDERIEALITQLRDGGGPEVGQQLQAGVQRLDTELTELTGRTTELSRQVTDLQGRLSELTDARGLDLKVHQKVIRAIESLEHTVGGILEHTLERLDQEVARSLGSAPADADLARGVVCGGMVGAAHDALIRRYERCLVAVGLHVRFRVSGGSDPRHARLYVSGRGPRELEREFLGWLDALRPGGAVSAGAADRTDRGVDAGADQGGAAAAGLAALQELIGALRAVDTGFAQLGPLVIARTPGGVHCGVLTLAECRDLDTVALLSDPAAVAERLATLPAERVQDLPEGPADDLPGGLSDDFDDLSDGLPHDDHTAGVTGEVTGEVPERSGVVPGTYDDELVYAPADTTPGQAGPPAAPTRANLTRSPTPDTPGVHLADTGLSESEPA